jgi:amino acid transporter
MLLVSSLACGLAGHVGAARLLYSMGRDDVLPRKVFGHLSSTKSIPSYSIWIVGGLAYIGVVSIPWEHAAEVVAFGGLLAFMGVNFSSFQHFWLSPEVREHRKFWVDAFIPAFGFLFCFLLLISLQTWTMYAGFGWLIIGTLYVAWKTRGFRLRPTLMDFSDS